MASLQPSALALHATHTPSADPVNPYAQKQWNRSVLARAEIALSGHAVHGAEPVSSLYCPSAHASHGPPSGPVYPLLQLQLVRALLPCGADACAGQLEHIDEPGAAA
eukprot:3323440-Rhodomonas_salina.1